MCAWRFKISVARRQHSNFGDEAGLTIQASLSHFSLSPPAQRASKRPPKWAAYAKSRWRVFLHPRYLLPPSAQTVGSRPGRSVLVPSQETVGGAPEVPG